MRIIFAGTPDFSVPALQALLDHNHEVVAVYTQPDRKKGRGQKLVFSPVKSLALEHDIIVHQPTSLKTTEAQQIIANLKADVMIVVAYGMILPKNILETPRLGCLNIHASLLPRWRGAAPIQRALQMQDTETGVCIMQMDVGLDTGDVLHESTLPISQADTSQTLHNKLSELGAEALITTLNNIDIKRDNAKQQNNELSTYANKISKSEALINWDNDASTIDCLIRAFNPWPVCETTLKGERIRIWMSSVDDQKSTDHSFQAGQIVSIEKNHINVACKKGIIKLTKLQKDGGQPLEVSQFINGFSLLSTENVAAETIVFGK